MPANAELVRSTRALIEFLTLAADKLDDWAEDSRTGGWSTHQVEGNRALADACRRQAAGANRILRDVSNAP